MATRTAVGSAAWVAAEKENVVQLLDQEKEEMIFPAQHEMEWLNEHMAEIFQKSSLDVANVFKTPGKLRGKTPRTVRKRVVEQRAPLSNVFSAAPLSKTSPSKYKGPDFAIAKDVEEVRLPPKSQTDSGYQGSSQVEEPSQKTPELPPRSPLRALKSPLSELKENEDEVQTNEGSFHSAKENQTVKLAEPLTTAQLPVIETQKDVEMKDIKHPHFEDIGSPSDESTPDRPLMRKKSSMNFASLPAREPLKNSIGAAISRSSHGVPGRESQRVESRSASAAAQYPDSDFEMSGDESNIEILGVDESQLEFQVAKQYSKASTQRLHERIDALGKIPPARPSKSIPSAAVFASISKTSATPKEDQDETREEQQKAEGEWIRPLKDATGPVGQDDDNEIEDQVDFRAPELIAHEQRMQSFSSSPQRPVYGHVKSASTATLASPNKISMAPPASPAKSISGSHPVFESTTPQGSPSRFIDGPLSASKSKLASIMKTAKGLFTSSASVSAAAKLDALNTIPKETMPGAFSTNSALDKPLPASPPKEARRTRQSSEREKEAKQRQERDDAAQKMDEQLDQARELEKQRVTQQHASSPKKENERVAASSSKVSRPVKGNRDISKSKPQPVSIKVGTLSHRMNANQEILQGEPKRIGLVKKSSAASLQQGSSNIALKSSVSSQASKPRALLAAERKKEQDEKEAQRKLDQKREIERKRAAQQEEARRQEQGQRAEAEKKERERIAAERAKRQAQQQAIEKKRQDAARKAEQQRADRAANDAAASRPPSRLGQQTINRPLINHTLPTNPAKPAKRPLEEENARPPTARFGASTQQMDAKRRRTDDETNEAPTRPTMSGAPIRQSQLGKKPSIFSHSSYQQVPTQAHLGQFPQPPRNPQQMAQYATSKIPFAEPSNAGLAKTPLSAYQQKTIQPVKSSPQYQNGESIHLPDIPTDSEDESDNESNAFTIPEWATSGHLIEHLMQQEGMDGDAVFGPIAPLRLEEIFAKSNKDRLKRLRDRTSSANWAMSGDGLTLEEVKADREQRERMRVQGGWQYGP